MRISFTGAQSTGKTTLLEAIKQNEEFRYKYEFIDEITRRMIKKGLKFAFSVNHPNIAFIAACDNHVAIEIHNLVDPAPI